ncbi:MAG: YkgJ family cysteine cluster protein [Syntrophorhabdaceae bacterium]|nr:YkgJ family cysteine cluster protein [Syntrophorhabdaceae bacterium]MDD4196979.1 YkgJ family cysteine cluster protein [Syntrophorhabdaceae bacterium]HOC46438.1 YkgJ family cysteine cluster protein [Syntrophorhabdaceae bacterium]
MNGEEHRDIACRRCGNCCHVDVSAYVSLEDVRRWEKEERHDIIEHVRANDVAWSGGRVINRFGSNIKTCRMSCVYLKWYGSSASCEIYETRTKVCRSYVPGSSGLCPQYHSKFR